MIHPIFLHSHLFPLSFPLSLSSTCKGKCKSLSTFLVCCCSVVYFSFWGFGSQFVFTSSYCLILRNWFAAVAKDEVRFGSIQQRDERDFTYWVRVFSFACSVKEKTKSFSLVNIFLFVTKKRCLECSLKDFFSLPISKRCLECVTPRQLSNVEKAMGSLQNVDGFDMLTTSQQDEFIEGNLNPLYPIYPKTITNVVFQ